MKLEELIEKIVIEQGLVTKGRIKGITPETVLSLNSTVIIYNVTYDDGSEGVLPSSFVIKTSKDGQVGFENLFYRHYGSVAGLPVLKVYYADEEVIIMENISGTHTIPAWPANTASNLVQATQCIAGFHARLLNPGNLRETSKELIAARGYADPYISRVDEEQLRRFMDEFGSHINELGGKCYSFLLSHLKKPRAESRYASVVSGDPHPWNFWYPKKHGNTILFDFGEFGIGSPTDDLAHLALYCEHAVDRRIDPHELKDIYFGIMRNQGFDIGVLGIEYRKSQVRRLLTPAWFWARGIVDNKVIGYLNIALKYIQEPDLDLFK